jgi:subtilisin
MAKQLKADLLRSTAEASEPPQKRETPGEEPGWLITFEPEETQQVLAALRNDVGVSRVAATSDFDDGGVDLGRLGDSELILFERSGVAVLKERPEAGFAVASAQAAGVRTIEREPRLYASSPPLGVEALEYLRGYREGVEDLCRRLAESSPVSPAELGALEQAMAFQDTEALTWGLQATQAGSSSRDGKGVRVAVLDTGLDLQHPDFVSRTVDSKSFTGELVQDLHGHGTHCAGIAAGARIPARGPRYGVATGAELLIGKVLSNRGTSLGRSVIAGIEWAILSGCKVISLSLGSRVALGETHLLAFERVGQSALAHNCLLVAAAGNGSRRSAGQIRPVESPANCPSILAVAALDSALAVASFSNGAMNPTARVDLAGPGVEVWSSVPQPAVGSLPAGYVALHGTSMATPFVAGTAALLWEANPSATAHDIWRILTATAGRLPLPARDVGSGLVQAPAA